MSSHRQTYSESVFVSFAGNVVISRKREYECTDARALIMCVLYSLSQLHIRPSVEYYRSLFFQGSTTTPCE